MKSKKGKSGNQPPRNNNAQSSDIKIICAYSLKKNIANVNEEYSVLKPDTNSLSPSAWSKGARFVSAKQEMKNMKKAGNKGTANQISCWAFTISVKFKI